MDFLPTLPAPFACRRDGRRFRLPVRRGAERVLGQLPAGGFGERGLEAPARLRDVPVMAEAHFHRGRKHGVPPKSSVREPSSRRRVRIRARHQQVRAPYGLARPRKPSSSHCSVPATWTPSCSRTTPGESRPPTSSHAGARSAMTRSWARFSCMTCGTRRQATPSCQARTCP